MVGTVGLDEGALIFGFVDEATLELVRMKMLKLQRADSYLLYLRF